MLEAKEIPEWITGGVLDVLQPLTSGLLAPVTEALGLEDAFIAAEEAVESFDYDAMKQFALQINVMINDREDVYIRDSNRVEPRLVRFSEQVAGALGLDFQGTYTVPLAATLAQT